MKKYLFLLTTLFALFSFGHVVGAASDFGDKSILSGKELTAYYRYNTDKLTDGSDSTFILVGSISSAYPVMTTITPTEYIDRVYIRSSGPAYCVTLTFTDDTSEKICTPSGYESATDRYMDVVEKQKAVKHFLLEANVGGFVDGYNVYEVDLRRNTSVVPPSIPIGLSAAATSEQVVLNWTGSAGADGYNIYQDGVKKNTALITQNNYTVTGLTNNKTYKWKVSAVNGIGESDKSDEVSSYYNAIPEKPIGLKVTTSAGKAVLTWATDPANKSYNIYRNGTKIGSSGTTSYTATGLIDNVEYAWQVSGVHAGNESELSAVVKALFDTIPPSKPLGLLVTPLKSGGRIQLQWVVNNVADGVSGYKVFQDGVQVLKVNESNATVSAEPLKEKKYTVKAYDATGNESEESDFVKATALAYPDTTPPDAPINLVANGMEGKISLGWRANAEPDINGYYIYRNNVLINTVPIKSNSFNVIGGLAWGTVYTFHIAAVDLAGNVSGKSNEAKAAATMPLDAIPPSKPTGLTATINTDATHIVLNWKDNPASDEAIGYYIYVSSDNLVWEKVNANSVSTAAYSYPYSNGLVKYYFQITGIDAAGNESKPSSSIQITTPSRDPNETGKPTEPSLIVSWDAITGAIGYLVYYNGNLIANLPASQLQYEITKDQGYDPKSKDQNVTVKARFIDGSIGENGNSALQGKWGFNVSDLWLSFMYVIGTISGFILLGIVIAFAPRLIKLIRLSIQRRRRSL